MYIYPFEFAFCKSLGEILPEASLRIPPVPKTQAMMPETVAHRANVLGGETLNWYRKDKMMRNYCIDSFTDKGYETARAFKHFALQ